MMIKFYMTEEQERYIINEIKNKPELMLYQEKHLKEIFEVETNELRRCIEIAKNELNITNKEIIYEIKKELANKIVNNTDEKDIIPKLIEIFPHSTKNLINK